MTSRPGQHRRVVRLIADVARGPAAGGNGPGPRPLEPTEPRPEFVRDLRAQLMTQATAGSAPQRAAGTVIPIRPDTPTNHGDESRRRWGYRLGAVAAALVIGLGSLSLFTQSAPPEPVYPANLGHQTTQPISGHGRAESSPDHLGLARRHLHQAEVLASNSDTNDTPLVSRALRSFSFHAGHGIKILLRASPHPHPPDDAADELTTFSRASRKTLDSLADDLPRPAEESYSAATSTLSNFRSRVTRTASPTALDQPVADQEPRRKPTAESAHTASRQALSRLNAHRDEPRLRSTRRMRAEPHRASSRTAPHRHARNVLAVPRRVIARDRPQASSANNKHAPLAKGRMARARRTRVILQDVRPGTLHRLLTALRQYRAHTRRPPHPQHTRAR